MSGTTKTPNYNLLKPNVGADNDLWGDHLNTNADTLDALIKSVDNKTGVVTFNARNGAVTLTNADVVTVLPASTTAPLINGTATAGLATTWSKGDHVHPTDTTRAAASSVPSPSATAPSMNSVADAGVAVAYSRGDHVHPVDTSRYAASNPSGYQTAAQVTTALLPYAPLNSPGLTGSPTAPTVTPSTDSTTKLATTAFVQSALGAVPGGAVIAATAPAGLNPGALWWDSTGGQLYVRYDDGNTQQWVAADNLTGLANAATQNDVAMAQNNVGRNKLHNGLFTVAQRGAGPFTANLAYTADRWQISGATDTVSVSVSAASDAIRTAVGDEAITATLVYSVTGNAAAGAYSTLQQAIEGVRRLAGKTVILSFWAAVGSGTFKLGVNYLQSPGTGGSPSAAAWSSATGQSVTVTTTWTRYSIATTLASMVGKTAGTNGDDNTRLALAFSSGATNNVLFGSVGVQSGGVFLAGIQLEIAAPGQTQPSPLEKLDPRMELNNCQRFYQIGSFGLQGYASASAISIGANQSFTTQMRATPTMTNTESVTTNMAARSVTPIDAGSFRPNGQAANAFGYIGTYTASADL